MRSYQAWREVLGRSLAGRWLSEVSGDDGRERGGCCRRWTDAEGEARGAEGALFKQAGAQSWQRG